MSQVNRGAKTAVYVFFLALAGGILFTAHNEQTTSAAFQKTDQRQESSEKRGATRNSTLLPAREIEVQYVADFSNERLLMGASHNVL